jgi:hypothetical protein
LVVGLEKYVIWLLSLEVGWHFIFEDKYLPARKAGQMNLVKVLLTAKWNCWMAFLFFVTLFNSDSFSPKKNIERVKRVKIETASTAYNSHEIKSAFSD